MSRNPSVAGSRPNSGVYIGSLSEEDIAVNLTAFTDDHGKLSRSTKFLVNEVALDNISSSG